MSDNIIENVESFQEMYLGDSLITKEIWSESQILFLKDLLHAFVRQLFQELYHICSEKSMLDMLNLVASEL